MRNEGVYIIENRYSEQRKRSTTVLRQFVSCHGNAPPPPQLGGGWGLRPLPREKAVLRPWLPVENARCLVALAGITTCNFGWLFPTPVVGVSCALNAYSVVELTLEWEIFRLKVCWKNTTKN